MWARWCEILIGLWLAGSFLLFEEAIPVIEMACGLTIVLLAALSFRQQWHSAHLGELLVALFLVGLAYFSSWPEPATPAEQNQLLTALLIATFAIVPSHAADPPVPWQQYNRQT